MWGWKEGLSVDGSGAVCEYYESRSWGRRGGVRCRERREKIAGCRRWGR